MSFLKIPYRDVDTSRAIRFVVMAVRGSNEDEMLADLVSSLHDRPKMLLRTPSDVFHHDELLYFFSEGASQTRESSTQTPPSTIPLLRYYLDGDEEVDDSTIRRGKRRADESAETAMKRAKERSESTSATEEDDVQLVDAVVKPTQIFKSESTTLFALDPSQVCIGRKIEVDEDVAAAMERYYGPGGEEMAFGAMADYDSTVPLYEKSKGLMGGAKMEQSELEYDSMLAALEEVKEEEVDDWMGEEGGVPMDAASTTHVMSVLSMHQYDLGPVEEERIEEEDGEGEDEGAVDREEGGGGEDDLPREDDGKMACAKCEKPISSKKSGQYMRFHLPVHSFKDEFSCSGCLMTFPFQTTANLHNCMKKRAIVKNALIEAANRLLFEECFPLYNKQPAAAAAEPSHKTCECAHCGDVVDDDRRATHIVGEHLDAMLWRCVVCDDICLDENQHKEHMEVKHPCEDMANESYGRKMEIEKNPKKILQAFFPSE